MTETAIIKTVADVYGVQPSDILGSCRRQCLVDARQLVAAILEKDYGFSRLHIAATLACDHSSVYHLLTVRPFTKQTRRNYREIKSQINPVLE